jgi:arabinogalactan endo-1,4-beta-galactosidase
MRFAPRVIPIALGIVVLAVNPSVTAQFYMGGDVSLLPYIESRGGVFEDAGGIKAAERIMVENGSNLFRLRLFVNPDPNYAATAGAMQDLDYTIALAQRLKASGAKILLDFHYSDTWADPGNQDKPAAWASQNFATLNTTIRNYTRDSLLAMRNAGVMPEMVQVGNEITHGMLWGTSVSPPNGGHVVYTGSTQTQNQSWMNFGSLLNSAIAGVRDVDGQTPGQRTPIAVHIDGGNVQGRAQYYWNQLTNVAGVPLSSYEILGLSFYASGSNSFTYLQQNLNHLANNYDKKVMVLENNYRWKGQAMSSLWPSTPEGQRDQLVAVRDLVKNLPNGRGAGVVWWYPESIQVPNTFIWQGGGVALFDDDTDGSGPDNHDALPALYAFQSSAPTWNINASGNWTTAANWQGGVPNAAGVEARFGPIITSPQTVTLNSPQTVATMTFLSANSYTIGGTNTLTLNSTSGPAAINVIAGDHTIAAPVALADDTEIIVAWDNSLTVSGNLNATGRTITKFGSGTAQFENIRAGALNVQFGTVTISQKDSPNDPAGTSVVGSLSIANLATLDLTNNSLTIDYTSSPAALLEHIRQDLHSGRLTSSAADDSHRLGFADDPAASSALIMFTIAGDANLDGAVDAHDLGRLATSWNSSSIWTGGDFDYSGFTDISDLALLAANWDSDLGSFEAAAAALDLPAVSVPEPTRALVLFLLVLLLAARYNVRHAEPHPAIV